jgi:polar amino acid transport system substrate-binding protein
MGRTQPTGHGIEPKISSRPRSWGRPAVLLAAWLVTLPALAVATEPAELRLASDAWPPFTDGPGRQRVAVALVETALERAGIRATTTIADWKDVEAGIRRGTFDGSAAMWRTDRRERDLVFSEPYLENRLVIIGRKGSDVSALEMADLAGKRVAAVGRYAYGDEIDKAVGVIFVNGRNDQDDLNKLLAGEVEYMLVDELVARYLVAYQPEEAAAKLEIGATPMARRTLHFVLRRDVPGAEDIVKAFNEEILGMLADGTYAEILQVGWIRVDVDGDGLDELVALGDTVGELPPGSVYDVFGKEPEIEPEKQRVYIQGSMFEGWDAIPDHLKAKGPAGQNDPTIKQGTTLFTLKF